MTVAIKEDNDLQRECLHPNWQEVEKDDKTSFWRCFSCGATAPELPIEEKTEATKVGGNGK